MLKGRRSWHSRSPWLSGSAGSGKAQPMAYEGSTGSPGTWLGWVPTEKSTGAVTDVDARDELDELQGLSRQEINDLKFQQAENRAPATAQQEADQQADMWHKHWGDGLSIKDVQWPDDMGEDLPGIIAEASVRQPTRFRTKLDWGGTDGIRRLCADCRRS